MMQSQTRYLEPEATPQIPAETARTDVTAVTGTLVCMPPEDNQFKIYFRATDGLEGDRGITHYDGQIAEIEGPHLVLTNPDLPVTVLRADMAEPKMLHRLGLRPGDQVELHWS